MADKLDSLNVKELLDSLYLPQLKYDLDSVPIESEHFIDYRMYLEHNLPLLFDQHKQIYESKELHSSFIILLCELAPETCFRMHDERLLLNVQRFLKEQQAPPPVEALIFDYYKEKLKKNVWKVNLGAVHGYACYLQNFYNEKKSANRKLEGNWLNFSLAFALNIRDCHEHLYKQLGINVFLIILQKAYPDEIRQLNVHSVIYDNVLRDVHSMDANVAALENIWNCLFLCLDFFEIFDTVNWCQVDDLIEILIRNIPLTNNTITSVCLFNYVSKLCTYFTINRSESFQSLDAALYDESKLEESRNACVANTSCTIFRWAKNILELIIFESHKLMHDIVHCLKLLKAMHKCYLVSILPIPLPIIEPHLIVFFEKFTAVLMEMISVHEKQKKVVKETNLILETFIWQLNRDNYDTTKNGIEFYKKALEDLCKNKIFC